MFDVSQLRFGSVTDADLPRIKALEAASYPADEAASEERLEFRLRAAPQWFRKAEWVSDEPGVAPRLIGYVVGTQSAGELTEASMASHDPIGDLLCVHSVVVDATFRRQGVASMMLIDYIAYIRSISYSSTVQKVVLIAKADKCALYEKCGFTFVRESPVVHGVDRWNELELRI
ncbi:Polyamine N-acetyltransferase 1 [Porphyridium purpureum]|uniref:Polyamine N-acetyltransferase 1 n=1 Tax=Porphyridium purpureum TaxID=35688 RepID=A0A5J4YK28_PORPP|nr:Polyamine N-acetyltransferase 1 [Porphyridium purpureum]|eukprot:POR2723..scf246_12